ncbi:flagellin [Magnetospirillum fulvum]|uniref:Flagellin n=1 Tax=Magnetospirillum fulvum MGU-K5 TaxID=1316936 RepID=S9S816_MAGFU|nr:flagellin [Magnetospirillum fulvum]EPY00794.1 flagellin domain-containing protein [Magnetospirillum fulvum MGU-K5]
MADVTLTSAMRSNLYSLQGTASLMATIQGRLSTGKKVNSALDNPSNYFAAQSLTQRASDLSALLDGMGQAIQALTTASQGITTAQKTIDQMKSIANSAAQSITTASNASGTNVVAYTALGTKGANAALAQANAGNYALTNLADSAGASLNVLNGDSMTVQVGTGATYTFTVGASAVNNATLGNGGGTTAKDLTDWMSTITKAAGGGVANAVTLTGGMFGSAGNLGAALTFSGTLATTLGLTSGTGATTASGGKLATTVEVDSVAYTGQAGATGSTLLSELSDANGKVLTNSGPTTTDGTHTGPGTFFTLAVSGGQTTTLNITATTTVQDVMDTINSISGLTASLDSTGALKVVNNNSTAVSIEGTASGLFGTANGSIGANASVSTTLYHGYGKVSATNLPTTNLTNLQAPTGQSRLVDGDQLKLTMDGVTTTLSVKTASPDATKGEVGSVADLMTALGKIPGITASLDNTTGQLDIRSTNGKTITFSGSAANKLSLPPSVAAGQSSISGSGVSATYIKQYDDLAKLLDQQVQDANYKGINLISSTGNNPLSVTFNEAAFNANKLVVNAVDLTSKGLGLTASTGNWKDANSIQASLSQLTMAATTLRETSAVLGQNLTTVQNRQDFTNNMIATLKTGSDNLTLADMNEESANMLALQTRQQLGIQSLSLASQANQAVMRLFG